MDYFVWNSSLSVGIAEIDDQHKKLIALINELYRSITTGEPPINVEKIIHELEDYTKYHFGTEEKYFQKFDYPETAAHEKEHSKFRFKLAWLRKDYRQKKSNIPQDIFAYLKDWLMVHITQSDQRYVRCFKDHGLR